MSRENKKKTVAFDSCYLQNAINKHFDINDHFPPLEYDFFVQEDVIRELFIKKARLVQPGNRIEFFMKHKIRILALNDELVFSGCLNSCMEKANKKPIIDQFLAIPYNMQQQIELLLKGIHREQIERENLYIKQQQKVLKAKRYLG